MVMAAGLGKRMRPLTATRPKPLIEVGGKALLDHVLDRLRAAGVKKVVVNVHYLADALEAHLASRAHGLEVVISDERELLLETGGGLVKAEPLIDGDPFLAVNSDNLWVDGPADTLKLLASHWDDAQDGCAAAAGAAGARAQPQRAWATSTWTATGGFAAASAAMSRRSSSPASRWSRSGCCAMRRRGRSRPTSCGTGRSRRAAASAPSTRACGSTSARPQSIPMTEAALENV